MLKVSVITVCFNSAATIRDTVDSVLAQSYKNIEYIVVDGASTDTTLEILQSFQQGSFKLLSEPDSGIYDAMNKGIALATGDVVGLLNSDDVFESIDTIQQVVNRFQANSSVNIVFGDVVYVAAYDTNIVRRYYSSRKFRRWKLRFGWMPPHPATFVRKSVYDQYGLYNLRYEIASDYELFVRWLLVAGLPYERIDRVLVRMRHGGVSTAGIGSSVKLNREIVLACRSNGVYTNLFFLLFKIPFKLLELVRRPRSENR